MGNLGFYFDSSRCIGCRACQIACKDKNRIMEPGITFRTVKSYETGKFPSPSVYHVAMTCNHCEKPACVEKCPTGAMAKAADGTVQHDDGTCIGCQTCVKSCPYGVPKYFEEEGVCRKCDSCIAFRANGMNPVCVDACVMRALDFGDVDELEKKYGDGLVSELPSWRDGGTGPNVRIKPRESVLQEQFESVAI